MCSLKLRKSECRTSLFMTSGLCCLVTGEDSLGKEKKRYSSGVFKEAALCGALWCRKRKNGALVHVDNSGLTRKISIEIKG